MTNNRRKSKDARSRWQLTTRGLLIASGLIAAYLAVWKALDGRSDQASMLGARGPWLLDGAVLIVGIFLSICYHRWRAKSLWVLATIALAGPLVHLPSIFLDDQLGSLLVKLEILWSTFILSTLAGIAGSVLFWRLCAPPRHSVLWATVLLLLAALSTGMYVRSVHGDRRPTDEFRLSLSGSAIGPEVKIIFRRGISSFFASGGHFVLRFAGREAKPELNYLRRGPGYYYWSGARLRLLGLGLGYVHSQKGALDVIQPPLFVVVAPYWLMITINILFLIKHLQALYNREH